MLRVGSICVGLLALSACVDFTGERQRLGFASSATLDGGTAWTPEHALANGAEPMLAVVSVLATAKEPDVVALSTSRSIEAAREDGAFRIAGTDGWIGAEADGVTDDLHVRWRRVRAASFVEPAAGQVGLTEPVQEVGVLAGRRTKLGFRLWDADGKPLGWVPEQVDVELRGALTAEGLTITAEGPGTVRARWMDGPATKLSVVALDPAELDRFEVEEVDTPAGCAALVRAWSGDLPVLLDGGLRWSHTDEDGPVVPCDHEGTLPPTLR